MGVFTRYNCLHSFQRGFPWLIFRVHGGKPRFEHGQVERDGFHGEMIGRIDRPFNDQNFQSAVLKLVRYIILSVSIYRHDIHYQIFDIKMGRNVSRCFSPSIDPPFVEFILLLDAPFVPFSSFLTNISSSLQTFFDFTKYIYIYIGFVLLSAR